MLTHLGHLLQAGDSVQGYDLSRATLDDSIVDTLTFQCPDIVLVKKVYPEKVKKASKKHKRRTRRGKAKQETPVVLEDENEPDIDNIIEGSCKDDINGSVSDVVPMSGIQNKNILAASAFGWTGGDDEEYQAFHRRLASEEQDDQESEVYREIDEEERDEEIDGDLDRAASSVVDGLTVPI